MRGFGVESEGACDWYGWLLAIAGEPCVWFIDPKLMLGLEPL